jgi:clan AA aspartic protease
LTVRGPNGQSQGVAAIIDTGFSGHLTLPLAIIEALGLDHLGQGRALVGDGSFQVFNVFEAVLIWDEEPLIVDVASAETEPLIGMSLVYGHDLRIQAIEGGKVTIEKLLRM